MDGREEVEMGMRGDLGRRECVMVRKGRKWEGYEEVVGGGCESGVIGAGANGSTWRGCNPHPTKKVKNKSNSD